MELRYSRKNHNNSRTAIPSHNENYYSMKGLKNKKIRTNKKHDQLQEKYFELAFNKVKSPTMKRGRSKDSHCSLSSTKEGSRLKKSGGKKSIKQLKLCPIGTRHRFK